jgi:modulator of drug activity B
MKNVLIINGHQYYEGIAEGNLTKSFIKKADEFLSENGFEVKHTHIESGYDKEQEINKFSWANFIIFQYPVYWMGLPWLTKKYFDEVLTSGKQFENDGRSRDDASKKYGSGGLLKAKYMLSLTYNCPESEFSNKDGFFEGLSLDEANIATHKIFQFCGAKPLESYAIHDIFKGDMDLDKELEKFENKLTTNFL